MKLKKTREGKREDKGMWRNFKKLEGSYQNFKIRGHTIKFQKSKGIVRILKA